MSRADVVVVGAGLIGCSIARALARGGIATLVLDRDEPGTHASRAAAGMLTPLAEAPRADAFLHLLRESLRLFPALAAELREDGSEFYHGLILLASAFVHVNRGNRHGIAAQLGKARPFLESRAPHYLGLDIQRILDHATTCRQIVAEHPDAPPQAWPVLVPLPRLEFDPALVRGDEFELPVSDPNA